MAAINLPHLGQNSFTIVDTGRGSLLGLKKKTKTELLVACFYVSGNATNMQVLDNFSSVSISHGSYATFVGVEMRNNRGLVNLAKNTLSPIKSLPYILVFQSSVAKFPYNQDKYTVSSIRSFVESAYQSVSQQRQMELQASSQSRGNPSPRGGGRRGTGRGVGSGGGGTNAYIPEGMRSTQQQDYDYLDDEDDVHLATPDLVTPHNQPWDAQIKKIS